MVFFNDIYEMYVVMLTAFNYLTPVFYPIYILPPWLQPLEKYNPMYLFVSAAQQAIVGQTLKVATSVGPKYVMLPPSIPDIRTQLVSWATALVVLTIGWLLFTKMEGKFAYHF